MFRSRQLLVGRAGATVAETAVVLSTMLLFLLGIFEYGRFVMMRHLVDNAAREGARLAIVNTRSMTTPDIQDQVTAAMGGQHTALQGLNIQVYKANSSGQSTGAWTGAAFGDRIAVQIDATYQPLIPSFGILPTAVPVHARSMMRCEVP